MISPDGRWLAYVSNESGEEQVFVTSFPTPGPKLQISTDGGSEPAWFRDGKELYYRNGEQMLAVPISGGDELDAGSPQILFEEPFMVSSTTPFTNYDVTSDGRFLMLEGAEVTERIQIVLNWFTEVERLVPTPNHVPPTRHAARQLRGPLRPGARWDGRSVQGEGSKAGA